MEREEGSNMDNRAKVVDILMTIRKKRCTWVGQGWKKKKLKSDK